MAKRKQHAQEPDTLAARRELARRLIRKGMARPLIIEEIKAKFGVGLGTAWVNDETKRLREYKANKTALPTPPAPLKPEESNGKLTAPPARVVPGVMIPGVVPASIVPADPRLISALIKARQAFEFDGETLRLI